MPGRKFEGLVHKADFERLLNTPIRSRSAHFAVHHLLMAPARGTWRPSGAPEAKLSTDEQQMQPGSVDNLDDRRWLGTLVPKRHAKRAVTRNLLRRQIRAAMSRHAEQLPAGMWLVRVRSPFPKSQFRAAASEALRIDAAGELERLLARSLS